MPPVTKRAAARRDLVEHFVYLAENAGLEVAKRFMSRAGSQLCRPGAATHDPRFLCWGHRGRGQEVSSAARNRAKLAAEMPSLHGSKRDTAALTATPQHIAPTPRKGYAAPGCIGRKISGGTRSDLGRQCRRYLRQSKEDLPKARCLLLGLSHRPTHQRRKSPAARRPHAPTRRMIRTTSF